MFKKDCLLVVNQIYHRMVTLLRCFTALDVGVNRSSHFRCVFTVYPFIIFLAAPNKTIIPILCSPPLSNKIMGRTSTKFSSILSRFEKSSGSQFDLLRLASSSSLTSTTSSSRSSTAQQLDHMTSSSHESSYEASEHTGRASLPCRMLASWYDDEDDDSDDEIEIQETPAPSRSSGR